MARSRRRRRSPRPLAATIAQRTGWQPEPIAAATRPRPRPVPIDKRARAVLTALAALPRLAAELGMKVVAQPDGRVELLPGEPTTLVFHAHGQVQGVLSATVRELT